MDALASSYAPCEEFNLESAGAPPGAPLLAAPSEPLPLRSVAAGDVVEYTLSAKESFEAFMGKRYDPAQFAWGLGDGAALLTQDAVAPSHGAFERLAAHLSERVASGRAPLPGSASGAAAPTASSAAAAAAAAASAAPARLLSPLDRFARLLSGLQALQAELGEAAAAGGGGGGGSGGSGGGGMLHVLSEATAGAQERLLALQPAAAAAAARSGGGGALGGGGPVARAAPPDASVFRALARDAAALAEAQAQAEAAQARVRALAAALHERLGALERAAAAAPQ